MAGHRNEQPVHVRKLLDTSSTASRALFDHLETLLQLRSSLPGYLETPLREHCNVANYRGGILTLRADSAVWATRLRYSIPEILESIRKNPMPVNVRSIRVLVSPEQTSESSGTVPRPVLSQSTASLMQRIAESIDDAEISASIRRLCQNSSLKP